jgi:hypothetical protein
VAVGVVERKGSSGADIESAIEVALKGRGAGRGSRKKNRRSQKMSSHTGNIRPNPNEVA